MDHEKEHEEVVEAESLEDLEADSTGKNAFMDLEHRYWNTVVPLLRNWNCNITVNEQLSEQAGE